MPLLPEITTKPEQSEVINRIISTTLPLLSEAIWGLKNSGIDKKPNIERLFEAQGHFISMVGESGNYSTEGVDMTDKATRDQIRATVVRHTLEACITEDIPIVENAWFRVELPVLEQTQRVMLGEQMYVRGYGIDVLKETSPRLITQLEGILDRIFSTNS